MDSDQRLVVSSIRASGLLQPRMGVLALLSGGADSVCLLHALAGLLEPQGPVALHVNHGLRSAAADDERFCADLCARLGVRLVVERVEVEGSGNLEARARKARYEAAERVREREGLDVFATGHTATDQVETIVYRLAASPGRRALLGMVPRRGRLIRPMLEVTREQARAYCEEAGLAWREDETNLDRGLARNRIRLDVLPLLREIHPAAERNVLSTADRLREEGEVLDLAVDQAADQVAAGGHPPTVDASRLRELAPALRRLVLRRLAEQAAGGLLPLRGEQVREIEQLAGRGGSASLDLGGGLRAVVEYGMVHFQRSEDREAPEPATLAVPGRCRFGAWEVACELEEHAGSFSGELGSPDEPVLDAGKLEGKLVVRAWSDGDHMRPLGLDGSKSLQDLFTDRKVPRSLRRVLPVVELRGEIVWVAGVAVSELFKIAADTTRVAVLKARSAPSGDDLS